MSMQNRLQNYNLDAPFSNFVAIDIILQLPKDMLCLHSKDIVHNDLKLDNVLVKLKNIENRYVHMKLIDFKISKTKKNSCLLKHLI
uniref:Protein kinase domain-containing protein n=1 Tax=Physcomitrium patens TaxID=3218 RepID=A0A2K1JKV3_PHYPA|nr:hypothetical protein PHYPA_016825 [Physcomitrium patens]